MKAIGYIRVSTQNQTSNGVSLDFQKTHIQQYADAHKFQLVDMIIDEGISGATFDRPGMSKVIEYCELGDISHVIVWRLDRSTRNIRHVLSLTEDLFLRQNVQLHSTTESLDITSSNGRFVLTLLAANNQLDMEQRGENTKAALDHNRKLKYPSSHPPYGYKSNGRQIPMTVIPEEIKILKLIFHRWRYGWSYNRIAIQLNADNVLTKYGKKWSPSTIVNLVNRREWYEDVTGKI